MSGIEQEIAERSFSKGVREGINGMVRELLLSGYPIEKIARVSRLPVEEIMAMKEALKKDGQELPRKQ
jgi:predicted transposase YdaD